MKDYKVPFDRVELCDLFPAHKRMLGALQETGVSEEDILTDR